MLLMVIAMRRPTHDAMNDKAHMSHKQVHPAPSVTRHTIGPGSSLASYRIVKQIGSGGMGKVFEAVRTTLPRRVAIQVLLPDLRATWEMSSRMAQEASILDAASRTGTSSPTTSCSPLPRVRIRFASPTGVWLATDQPAGSRSKE